jgi:hypothetical protein
MRDRGGEVKIKKNNGDFRFKFNVNTPVVLLNK